MKRTIRTLAAAPLMLLYFLVCSAPVLAQETATLSGASSPRTLSYQGVISMTGKSGTSVAGTHQLTVTLYGDAAGTQKLWQQTISAQVDSNGIFNTTLGTDANPLPEPAALDRPMWLGVALDKGSELRPLSQVTASAYALNVVNNAITTNKLANASVTTPKLADNSVTSSKIADSSITADKIAVPYVGAISVNGTPITGNGTAINLTGGQGTSVFYDETTNSVLFSSVGTGSSNGGKGNGAPEACQPNWLLAGNVYVPGCNNTFGFTGPYNDILMVNDGSLQMTMLGSTGLDNGILIPPSSATGVGVIWEGTQGTPPYNTYIDNVGGFFAGISAGNLAMTGGGNTGIGNSALNSNSSGAYSTAIGDGALQSNQTSNANTASGYEALFLNTGSTIYGENTADGYQALFNNSSGTYNTAGGVQALYSNTTASDNTAYGSDALYSNTIGTDNTASGFKALYTNSTGNDNTASGFDALYTNTGTDNTANGSYALYKNSTGNNNTASGMEALYSNTSGTDNTASGVEALYKNTLGAYNTASGMSALFTNSSGQYNTATGWQALFSNTTASDNTADGYDALATNTGADNTAGGYNALYNNTTASDNTAYGSGALYSNTLGYDNTAVGFQALYSNTGAGGLGYQNTGVGYWALYTNQTGLSNTAIGFEALRYTTGSYNTACGQGALVDNGSGTDNTGTGTDALESNSVGTDNTANGFEALLSSTGNYNTACGSGALVHAVADGNTAVGYNAGVTINTTVGTYNTFLGYQADASGGSLTNATAIGANAVVAQSNTIQLGDANVQAVIVPVGTTAQRPASPIVGMVRFNTTLGQFEGWNGTAWHQW